jgi:sigma-B regulation protein RsbU (phosphoserine phosphatase)
LILNSLASKLSAYILTLTLAILAVTFVMMYRYNSAETKSHAEKYAMALLDGAINDVSWDFRDVEHIMDVTRFRVEDVVNNDDSIVGQLQTIVRHDNMVIGASVAFVPGKGRRDASGLMLYVSRDTANNISTKVITDTVAYAYPSMPWFTNALRNRRSSWSEPYFDYGCGERLMTTLSIPLQDAVGAVYAVLTADVSLVQLDDHAKALSRFDDDFTFILSGDGNYVAHSEWTGLSGTELYNINAKSDGEGLRPIYKKMLNQQLATEQIMLNGEKVLVCYAPLNVADWSICYVCPYSSILASLNDFTIYAEGALLLLVIALIFILWRIIKHQMRPAKKLAQATVAIAHGDFDEPLPVVKTKDEFQQLRDAFAKMQVSLKQYVDNLMTATQARQQMLSELRIAHDIQMHLIPSVVNNPRCPWLEIGALLRPAKEVGGDFYDYLYVDDRLYFAIADVSGKGVPAALIMATTRTHFRLTCRSESDPAKIVAKLNEALCADNDTNMFVTMFVGVVSLRDGRFTYCNAGHNPGFIVTADAARPMSLIPNLPLGVVADFDFKGQSQPLPPDSMLVFYTDGLTEAENPDLQMLGINAVADCLNGCNRLSAEAVVDRLDKLVQSFADGAEQSDDLTLVCIKNRPSLRLVNNIDSTAGLPAFVGTLIEHADIADDAKQQKAMMLNLALEEAVVNIINYAYPPGVVGNITISADTGRGTIVLTIVDNGQPFDPTNVAEPDTDLPLEQRNIGGLGIHLIRNIMSTVSYRRLDPLNILTLTFSL